MELSIEKVKTLLGELMLEKMLLQQENEKLKEELLKKGEK